MANVINNNKPMMLVILLLLFFISEAFTTIAFKLFKLDFHNYSALIKGGFMGLAIVYGFLALNTYRKHLMLFLCLMSIFFIIGNYAFQSYVFGEKIAHNMVYFSRYMLVFTIVLVFVENKKLTTNKWVYFVFEKIVVFNSLLILLGVFFDIPLFKTYYNRFGYNGLFMSPSISTYFYALSLVYFLNRYLTKKEKLFELVLVSLICFLTGARALTLYFCLTLIHLIWIKKWYLKRFFYVTVAFISTVIILLRQPIYEFLQKSFPGNFELYKQDGLITALTSFRNLKLKENFLPLIQEKWNIWNYLFGGTDFVKYRVEFEIFDVFLFFGIAGTLLYLFYYFKFIFCFKTLSGFGKVQIVLILFTALLSGTFFNNAPIALYLLVVLSSLYIQTNSTRNEI